MTFRSQGFPRFALLALAVASLSPAACGPFSESCWCPGAADRLVLPYELQSNPVVSVSAGSTCTATDIGDGRLEVLSTTGQTCVFTVLFEDGVTYRITANFSQFDPDGCCAGIYTVDDYPAYERVED
jgi:hypothetical protein